MALEFGAPWSRSLKAASLIAVAMLAVLAAAGMFVMPARLLLARCVMIGLPIVVLAIAFVSMVSGYTLTATQLEVERPLWNTVFPLAELLSVAGDQESSRARCDSSATAAYSRSPDFSGSAASGAIGPLRPIRVAPWSSSSAIAS
jgi:hypothetical protein